MRLDSGVAGEYAGAPGVKEAAGISIITTIAKLVPILVFIVAVIFVKALIPISFR
ncbi:MAG: hypothetical protein ACLTK0_09585 [Anaerovoracaceae bacterium]